jgi:Domain of unknown function (DUF6980)
MSKSLYPDRRVPRLPLGYDLQAPATATRHCCRETSAALVFDCEVHTDPFDCPDTANVFHELFGEYGLPIGDGGPSYLLISNCPFCGAKLPGSGRDAWFDVIEADGLDDVVFEDLPERYRTSAWCQS